MIREVEIRAYEGDCLVGIYVAPGPRAASWALRANPNATLTAQRIEARSDETAQPVRPVGRKPGPPKADAP